MFLLFVHELFVELVPPTVISDLDQLSSVFILCAKHGPLQFCLKDANESKVEGPDFGYDDLKFEFFLARLALMALLSQTGRGVPRISKPSHPMFES